jgi:mRNA interferase RelE/StbE
MRYAEDPLRHAIKLTASEIGEYRFRVGDYRIVFDLEHDSLLILAVGHRKDIYRT